MNRRIYYDGALINKIGIDRIVIKKVVLKEINAEKLDTALTCCAIHYDTSVGKVSAVRGVVSVPIRSAASGQHTMGALLHGLWAFMQKAMQR